MNFREARSLSTSKIATVTFGRMQPPHDGHVMLMDSMKFGGNDYFVFLSNSYGDAKNPLTPKTKMKWLTRIANQHRGNIYILDHVRNILDVAVMMDRQGYSELKVVVGDDRLSVFQRLLNKYNGRESLHGVFEFDEIKFKRAERLISATELREAAHNNDLESFKRGYSTLTDEQCLSLMQDIRDKA